MVLGTIKVQTSHFSKKLFDTKNAANVSYKMSELLCSFYGTYGLSEMG